MIFMREIQGGWPALFVGDYDDGGVPHPCVLCKGGNIGPVSLGVESEIRKPGLCFPPFRSVRERMGHPLWEWCTQRSFKGGPPAPSRATTPKVKISSVY